LEISHPFIHNMTLLHHIPYQAMVSENDQLSQIHIKVQTVVKKNSVVFNLCVLKMFIIENYFEIIE